MFSIFSNFMSLKPDSNWRVLADLRYKGSAIDHYAIQAFKTQ
jgi:hypothetical protein